MNPDKWTKYTELHSKLEIDDLELNPEKRHSDKFKDKIQFKWFHITSSSTWWKGYQQ